MKKFIVFTCLLASQALGKPSKRAAEEEGHEGECCAEKKVGNVLYQLFSEGDVSQLARYNCLNGCIYKDEEDPQGPSFCFAHGDLPVECMDDFHWCYEGNCGPEFWETRFEDCAGESQSPIDVVWPEDSLANAQPSQLTFEGYERLRAAELSHAGADKMRPDGDRLENGEVSNNGHTAVLGVVHDSESDGIMTGSADVLGEGQSYQMLQLHFHWGADDTKGSEHTINGEEFPMEMHIVHKKVGLTVEEALATPDGLAVVGQMFEISGEDNPVLTPLIESLANIENFDDKFDMNGSPLQVQDLLPSADSEYANYAGSLTTPTCNEAVRWILFKQPIQISASQMEAFRALKDKGDMPIVDNFRPPQPLNGREVNFFTA
jgi:carbonic anhydrase